MPEFVPSPNIVTLSESATIAVSARARAMRAAGVAVVDLAAGEPDFDTPAFIRRAGQLALDEGATRYTATEGIPALRSAIAHQATAMLAPGGGSVVKPDEVVVSAGSKQALMNTCFALFGCEDEVLIPTPAWTSYYQIARIARATPVPVAGDPASSLRVDRQALERAASPRTRGIIINSPCNPTGAIYDSAAFGDLLALAEERGWWVISDEIYRRISYESEAPSALSLAHWPSRLVVVDGVAKAYAMTGWRIGWAIAPRSLARAMAALQSHTTSNAAAVSQHAALAALERRGESDEAIGKMVAAFRERRDAVLAIVRQEPRLRWVHPEGAFYLFLDVSGIASGNGSAGTVFARHLLERQGIAVVPGEAFLEPDWIRISYASPLDVVVDGVRRVVAAYRELAGKGAALAQP
ncbi:MAG TPA: aminotransferase class I/II-fold pyridoxal phosphate-dependent enzyme [Gemmatimonadaceae bacterium]|nr:aminotransferase class I/II-fold pyridoxal phosphate-dependent enzyme [Gemmatimonadaceae bacterium]